MPERCRKRTNQDRGTDEVKQDRSLLLYVLLSFVTFSVYNFYFMDLWAKDVNILCEKDGKHTVGVEKMMLFSVLTFGVYKYVWIAEIVDRIRDNAAEYDVEVRQDSETFFVWMILVPVLGYLVAMYRAIQDNAQRRYLRHRFQHITCFFKRRTGNWRNAGLCGTGTVYPSGSIARYDRDGSA